MTHDCSKTSKRKIFVEIETNDVHGRCNNLQYIGSQTVLPVIVVTRPNFVHARAKSGE